MANLPDRRHPRPAPTRPEPDSPTLAQALWAFLAALAGSGVVVGLGAYLAGTWTP
jgi:hypothetical protein